VDSSHIDRHDSLAAITALLGHARDQGLTLRFVDSARPLSNVSQPAPDRQMVATRRYGAQPPNDTTTLSPSVDVQTLHRAEGGRVLADVLIDLAGSERSLANMGSGDFQSLAGALSTSTHGLGVSHPAFPGSAQSMDVINYDADNNVIVQRVEPTDGVTDPALFATWVATQPVPIQLDQNDAILNAWTVSIGWLDEICSLTISALPTYWLCETCTLEWWSDVQQRVTSDLKSVDYYDLLLSAWPTDNGGTSDFGCLVTRRVLATDPDQQKPTNGRPIAMAVAQTKLGHLATETAQQAGVTASEVSADAPFTDISYENQPLRMHINATSSQLGIALWTSDGQVDQANALTAVATILDMAAANRQSTTDLLGDNRSWSHDIDRLMHARREAPPHVSPIAVRFVAPSVAFPSMHHLHDRAAHTRRRQLRPPPRRPQLRSQQKAAAVPGVQRRTIEAL
jgi:hypothetical protein